MWLRVSYVTVLALLHASATWAAASTRFERFQLLAKPCPESCGSRKDPASWNFFHDIESISTCPEPVLLDFNLYNPINDPDTHVTIRACTLGDDETETNFLVESGYVAPDALGDTNFGPLARRNSNATSACGIGPGSEVNATASLTWWSSDGAIIDDTTANALVATRSLADHLRQDTNNCKKKLIFAYVRGTLVGLYSGAQLDRRQTAASLLERFADELESDDRASSSNARTALQVCDQSSTASNIFGIVADASGDFGAVQDIMKSWNDGECVSGSDKSRRTIDDISVRSFQAIPPTRQPRAPGHLNARAECRSIRVEGGDTCATLAARCGIGGTAFQNFNRATPNLCSTLRPGQPVCCSSGTLPDIKPNPGPDGGCATYEVLPDEGCHVIAAKHGVVDKELEDFNRETWGWNGCRNLQISQRICVSFGQPPMPAPVSNALCGPTVPGTNAPGKDEEMADLNPCPLDVCCNIWGQCGTTEDFCIISESETGNPGTSRPGENGCVSNCGMEIVRNDRPPEQYRKIGYFEAWNWERTCLNMHVLDIDRSYTHIHFAFGEISPDLQVVIPENQRQEWTAFISSGGYFAPKKILAFGGWAFSNEAPTSGRFRQAFSPANRETFADRVIRFAIENQLDGLDFDWEYPGATDIDGSDPGREDDGENYFQFLDIVRQKMPREMSLSIAAPASYWYLRGFPMKKMAEVLDYVVYMTYDLHGQWDVGNKWTMSGCPAGNCLRSHVNATMTHDALVMITKAGVPSHKVVVGVTSYGRSFKMADANCRGPMCTYIGERNNSPAKEGRCTDTSGYISNFEINEIIDRGGAIKTWYDRETDSDFLVYEGTEWVGYMSEITKSRRMRDYRNLNFGGTTDWAIDLQGEGSGSSSGGRPVYLDPGVYETPTARCEAPCTLVFPPSPLPSATTITPGRYTTSLEYGAMSRVTRSGTITTAFVTHTTTITLSLPIITTNSMRYSNINITSNQRSTALWLVPSISIPPITVSVPNGEGGTTVRTLLLPAWPAVTRGPPSGNDDDDDDLPGDPGGGGPGNTNGPGPRPDTTTTTTTNQDQPLPTYTTWPPLVVTPIPEHVERPVRDDEGSKTPCNLWFLNLCPNGDGGIGGLLWRIPPGVYPPGPIPPRFVGPPGPDRQIRPSGRPPVPRVTMGRDGVVSYPSRPNCQTEAASLCSTTTILSQTIVGPTTSTVTSTRSGCETIYGCSLTDWETAITTRTAACPEPTRMAKRDGAAIEGQSVEARAMLERRQSLPAPGCPANAIVYPRNPGNVGEIPRLLSGFDYQTAHSPASGFVGFYWVPMLDADTMARLKASGDVLNAFYYESPTENTRRNVRSRGKRAPSTGNAEEDDRSATANATVLDDKGSLAPRTQWPDKRQPLPSPQGTHEPSRYWSPAQISLPWREQWKDPNGLNFIQGDQQQYKFYYDNAGGSGQHVYVIGEDRVWTDHAEFTQSLGTLTDLNRGHALPPPWFVDDSEHASRVIAMINGRKLGTCKRCHVWRTVKRVYLPDEEQILWELIDAITHILERPAERVGKSVISLNTGIHRTSPHWRVGTMHNILRHLDSEARAVLVVAAGNDGGYINDYPTMFAGPTTYYNPWDTIHNMIVVGAADEMGTTPTWSMTADYLTTYSPGEDVPLPDEPLEHGDDPMEIHEGTSYAAPLVAGVAAYLRSVPSPWQRQLEDPGNVKKMVQLLHRRFQTYNTDPRFNPIYLRPVVWNGQVGNRSCLRDYDTRANWARGRCPEINLDLRNEPNNPGEPVGPCLQVPLQGRQEGGGGSCPLLPGGGGGGGRNIDWSQGQDFPRCPSGTCGGELCRGYYCGGGRPNTPPPDFRDPKDPNRPGAPALPPPGGGGDGGGPSPYNYGIRFSAQACSVTANDEYGMGRDASNCLPVNLRSFVVNTVQGFGKPGYNACFFNRPDCTSATDSDRFQLSGGDRIEGSDCLTLPGGQQIHSYTISEQGCAGRSHIWGLDFRTNCGRSVGRASSLFTTRCNTDIPDGADSAVGFTTEGTGAILCLYETTDCSRSNSPGSTDFMGIIAGGTRESPSGCFSALRAPRIGSYMATTGTCP